MYQPDKPIRTHQVKNLWENGKLEWKTRPEHHRCFYQKGFAKFSQSHTEVDRSQGSGQVQERNLRKHFLSLNGNQRLDLQSMCQPEVNQLPLHTQVKKEKKVGGGEKPISERLQPRTATCEFALGFVLSGSSREPQTLNLI